MLPLDEHMARVAMDMDKERERLQMGDRVPTRRPRNRRREGRLVALQARSRAFFAALRCRLASRGRQLQQRAHPAGTGQRRSLWSDATARLGGWLSGAQPQSGCG